MSELKEHQFCECDEIIREYRGQLSNEMRPYYLKSEADKVIAEKDTEIDGLKERIEVLNHQVCKMNCAMVKHYNEVCDDLIHHKHKRCLAMARWCCDRWVDIATPYVKSVWYYKWHKRWLELAEKFKPNYSTAQ